MYARFMSIILLSDVGICDIMYASFMSIPLLSDGYVCNNHNNVSN